MESSQENREAEDGSRTGKIIGSGDPGRDGAPGDAPRSDRFIDSRAYPAAEPRKMIPGVGEASSPANTSGQSPAEQPEGKPDQADYLREATGRGGLREVPADFGQRNGSWATIRSDNPFEVLYLDYRQHRSITPEMVRNNYEILSGFWNEKLLIMNRGARDQVGARYGVDLVNNAARILETAYARLRTEEGIRIHFDEIEAKRMARGTQALEEFLDLSLASGDFTEREAGILIQKGVKSGLTSDEVREYLLSELKNRGFKPRAAHPDPVHPFRNKWMTEEAWTQLQKREIVSVEWMGERVSSLEEIGSVTFRKREEADDYLGNMNFLLQSVQRVTGSATKALEFQRMMEEERENKERLFLSVVYHLNPALPFRFGDAFYSRAEDLLVAGCDNDASCKRLARLYDRGHLHIWLRESDAQVAQLLPAEGEKNGFLTFLYRMNTGFPFFVNGTGFPEPSALVAAASGDRSLWIPISVEIENGNLFTWFRGTGKKDWIARYNERFERMINSGVYKGDVLRLAAVQALILTVDENMTPPHIVPGEASVSLLSVEGGSVIRRSVGLRLRTEGFVMAKVRSGTRFDGIEITDRELRFDSLGGEREHSVDLTVDAARLSKDRLYRTGIQVETIFETVSIPVEVRVVFPLKAFMGKVVAYGVGGAVFLGAFRYLLALLTNHNGWLRPPGGRSFSLAAVDWLPGFPLIYFALFVLMIYLLFLGTVWIRKKEHI